MKSKQSLSPVMMTSAARQANKERSKFIRWRLCEKSMMELIQSPKLWAHCCRCRTTPLQKTSLSFSGFDLFSFKPSITERCTPILGSYYKKKPKPVSQAEDKELHERWFKEELLILLAEVCEPRDGLSPLSNNIQGPSEEVVELLDIPRVFLFLQMIGFLLILMRDFCFN